MINKKRNKLKIIKKKIWPDMFDQDKDLTLDFRCADFKVEPGDIIIFQEWDPKGKKYTGREYRKTVKQAIKCESPTRYWQPEKLEQYGIYLFEWED
jgi:hypothetical protein